MAKGERLTGAEVTGGGAWDGVELWGYVLSGSLFVSFSYFTSVNHMVLSETQSHGPWTVCSATSQNRYFFPSVLPVRYFGHSLTKITDLILIFLQEETEAQGILASASSSAKV